jgi:hypothetical protein
MNRFIFVLALLVVPTVASAQVAVGVHFGWAAPPPLIEINPGVQIVENGDQEIFFSNGYYWFERDGGWYRSHDWHERWAPVRGWRVPSFIRNHPRGNYVHWRGADHPNGWRGEGREHPVAHAEQRGNGRGRPGRGGGSHEAHGR